MLQKQRNKLDHEQFLKYIMQDEIKRLRQTYYQQSFSLDGLG